MLNLAGSVHRLRIARMDDDRSAAGALAGGTAVIYTLFANADLPAGAAAGHVLCADVCIGAEPPAPDLAFVIRPIAPAAPKKRARYGALAAALFLHLALLLWFIAWPREPKHLGLEDGLPESLNVSVISSADLKRLSSDMIRQDAPPPAPPALETPQPPEPQPPVQQEAPPAPQPPILQDAKAADSSPLRVPTEQRDAPYDPSAFIAMASEQFSAQLNQAFKMAETRREQPRQQTAKRPAKAAPNVTVLRPGATHVGKSDEFERAVIWALGATVPRGNGKWGTTIVTFVVSAAGQVEGLRMIKSSDDNWLDSAALLAVRQARMPVPPQGLPAGDRTFNVEYISLQTR